MKKEEMKNILYASAVGSLMYAQVCTRPDIAYVVGMLSNPCMEYWGAIKKVMWYLQGTKNYKLTNKRSEVVRYSDFDFVGCSDSRKSTSRYVFLLAEGAISWRSVKPH